MPSVHYPSRPRLDPRRCIRSHREDEKRMPKPESGPRRRTASAARLLARAASVGILRHGAMKYSHLCVSVSPWSRLRTNPLGASCSIVIIDHRCGDGVIWLAASAPARAWRSSDRTVPDDMAALLAVSRTRVCHCGPSGLPIGIVPRCRPSGLGCTIVDISTLTTASLVHRKAIAPLAGHLICGCPRAWRISLVARAAQVARRRRRFESSHRVCHVERLFVGADHAVGARDVVGNLDHPDLLAECSRPTVSRLGIAPGAGVNTSRDR